MRDEKREKGDEWGDKRKEGERGAIKEKRFSRWILTFPPCDEGWDESA